MSARPAPTSDALPSAGDPEQNRPLVGATRLVILGAVSQEPDKAKDGRTAEDHRQDPPERRKTDIVGFLQRRCPSP